MPEKPIRLGRPDQPTLRELARYTNAIADDAQLRKLQSARGENVQLYDDHWWQGVMDYVRFHLARLADEHEAPIHPETQG